MSASAQRGRPWWQNAVVYQVYLRSFQDTDGDGVGDLAGLVRRLDELAALGVDVLWLSPVHPSPDADFGYDVADYLGVHPALGTQADLDAVIAGARDRGLRVLLDGVFNHTSDQHPWFQSSRAHAAGPHGGWYLWHDGPHPPNNWQSAFGGRAWSRDPVRGAWYLHSFAPQQPDLNWREPGVADAVLDSMAHWLDRGVSGFRLDVFNCYLKDATLRSNPRRLDPVGLTAGLAYGYLGQRHLHDRDQPELTQVLGRMRRLVDAHDGVLVGETLDERFRYDNAAPWVGEEQLHLAFHFGLLHSRWGAASFARAIEAWRADLGPEGWPTWVVGNHDFPRVATRWGRRDDRMRLVALMLATLRGTPFLYQGDELALREARLSRAAIRDPAGRRYWPLFRGRDGCRTPMAWTPTGDFSSAEPWLALHADHGSRNVQTQRGQPDSVWSTWQQVLALRRAEPALQRGEMGPVEVVGTALRWVRHLGEDALEVWLNLGDRPVSIPAGGATAWSTHPPDEGPLRGCEGRVRRVRPGSVRARALRLDDAEA